MGLDRERAEAMFGITKDVVSFAKDVGTEVARHTLMVSGLVSEEPVEPPPLPDNVARLDDWRSRGDRAA
jgi:hypothetical protein